MKIKLKELKVAEESLNKIFSMNLPIKVSYILSKIIPIVSEEMNNIEKIRYDLIKKYGEEKEGQVIVIPSKLKEFITEFEDFLDTEIDFNFTQIPLSSFGDKIEISANDFFNLNKFIEEEK
jgi:hypothetical protein